MIIRTLLAPLACLALLATACSDEPSGSSAASCVKDEDCTNGMSCHEGFCSSESSIGENGVQASGTVIGAPPGVTVEVTTEDCKGPSCEIEPGSPATFTAPPLDGYRFMGWSGGPLCMGTDLVLMIDSVTSSVRCAARYVKRVTITGTDGVEVSSKAPFAECDAHSCEVDQGSGLVLKAPVRDGYRFVGFSGENCSYIQGIVARVAAGSEDSTCGASYVKTAVVSGVAPSGLPAVVASSEDAFKSCAGASCTVDVGSTVVLTASAVPGLRFSAWSGEGCSGASPTLTLADISGDLTCTAEYTDRLVVAGTVAGATGAVTVTSSDSQANCSATQCEVDAGASASFAAPNLEPAFRFAGWTGGCSGGLATTLSDISSSTTCTAHYVARFTVTGQSSGAAVPALVLADSLDAFKACSENACTTDSGGSVTLTAATVVGSRFVQFSGTGCEQASGASVTVSPVNGNVTCTAEYEPGIAVIGNVDVPNPSADVAADSSEASAECSGSACVLSDVGDVTLTAPDLDAQGYRFTSWSGDPGCTGSNAELVLIDIAQSMTCTAHYVPRFAVSGSASPSAAGTVTASSASQGASCSANQCLVDEHADADLTAANNAGFRFSGWTGGGQCTGTTATITISDVTAQIACSASFIARHTVSFPDPAQGAVTASNFPTATVCDSTSCIADDGSALRLTAQADSGFRFVSWSDCSTSTAAILNLAGISADATCNTTFIAQWVVAGSLSGAPTGAQVTASASAGAPSATCTNGAGLAGSCTVDQGLAVTLTAADVPGYAITGWTGAGCVDEGSDGNVATLLLNNVGGAFTCAPVYTTLFSVSAVSNNAALGAVTVTSSDAGATCSAVTGGQQCLIRTGETATLDPSLAAGQTAATARFVAWSGDCGGSADPFGPQPVTDDVLCAATFTARYTVASSLVGAPAGADVDATASATSPAATCTDAAPGEGSCNVDSGLSVTLTANTVSGFVVTGWTGTGCTDAGSDGLIATLQLNSVTGDRSCVPVYTQTRVVSAVSNDVSLGTVDVSSSDSLAVCSAITNGEQCVVRSDQPAALDPVLASGQSSSTARFTGWSGNCSGTSDPLNLAQVSSDTTCTANFTARFTVTGTGAPSGSVTASSSQTPPVASCSGASCTVDSGAAVTLTAPDLANSNYVFEGWSGTGCTDSNADQDPLTLQIASVTANATCTAVYYAVIQVSLTSSSASSPVTITDPGLPSPATCTSTRCELPIGTNVTINAPDGTATRFVSWSGSAGCSGAQTHSVALNAPTFCDATFYGLWGRAYSQTGGTSGTGLIEGNANDLYLVGRGAYTDPATGARSIGLSFDTVAEHTGSLVTSTSDELFFDDKMTALIATDIAGDPSAYAIMGLIAANPTAAFLRVNNGGAFTNFYFRASAAHSMDDLVAVPGTGYAGIGYEAVVNPETGADESRGRLIAVDEAGSALIANRLFAALTDCADQQPYPTRTVGIAPHETNGSFDGWVAVHVATIPSAVLRGVSFEHTFLTLLSPAGVPQLIEEITDLDDSGVEFPLEATGIATLADGSYVLYGQRVEAMSASTTLDAFWVKLSSSLAITAQGRMGSADLGESFTHAAETPDGSLGFVGRFVQAQRTDVDAWFVRLDKAGSLTSQAAYSSTTNDALNRIRPLALGGFGMHGTLSSSSFGATAPPPPLAWALRSDDEGTVPFVANGSFTLFTPTHAELSLKSQLTEIKCFAATDDGDSRVTVGVISLDGTTSEAQLAP